jgi:hypothetical protein
MIGGLHLLRYRPGRPLFVGTAALVPLGLTIVGPVAGAIGLTHALWLAAAIVAGSMLSALTVRDVRELRRKDAVPPQPAVEAAA